MRPNLAVLITYFNEGESLTRCFESLGDSVKEIEFLIYDDCSKIKPEIFIPKHIQARVFRGEKNVGPGIGRNRLLAETRAEFIHFHDADDIFLPNWFKKVSEALENVDAVFTEVRPAPEKGAPEVAQGLPDTSDPDELTRFCLAHAILTSAGTYRREVVRRIGGYRESLWQSEDYDFHIRLSNQKIRFKILQEPLIARTQTAGRSRERLEVWLSALQSLRFLSQELPNRFRLDLAEATARVSSHLYRLGARREAKKGFQLALRVNLPRFDYLSPHYRWVAQRFGPEIAEWIGGIYRTAIPEGLRKSLRNS